MFLMIHSNFMGPWYCYNKIICTVNWIVAETIARYNILMKNNAYHNIHFIELLSVVANEWVGFDTHTQKNTLVLLIPWMFRIKMSDMNIAITIILH